MMCLDLWRGEEKYFDIEISPIVLVAQWVIKLMALPPYWETERQAYQSYLEPA